MNRTATIISMLFLFINCNLSSQVLTDSTIAMIAFWKIGDKVVYEFSETIDKLSKSEKTLETTSYDVAMSIIDSTSNNYKVKWEYSNYERDYKLDQFEKDLYEVCSKIPVLFITNEYGSFESVENWEVMSKVAGDAFNKWLIQKPELPDSTAAKMKEMLNSMFSNQKQVNFLARDLKFFHYLYGINLDRESPYEGVKYYSNPFLKTVMPGREKVIVQAIDEQNWIAKVKVISGIGGKEAKALMLDFMKKNMRELGLTDESEINSDDIPEFSTSEELEIIYNIETGYILKGKYQKITKLDSDYKNTTYDFKLKK